MDTTEQIRADGSDWQMEMKCAQDWPQNYEPIYIQVQNGREEEFFYGMSYQEFEHCQLPVEIKITKNTWQFK
jgi:hypothetical protein